MGTRTPQSGPDSRESEARGPGTISRRGIESGPGGSQTRQASRVLCRCLALGIRGLFRLPLVFYPERSTYCPQNRGTCPASVVTQLIERTKVLNVLNLRTLGLAMNVSLSLVQFLVSRGEPQLRLISHVDRNREGFWSEPALGPSPTPICPLRSVWRQPTAIQQPW